MGFPHAVNLLLSIIQVPLLSKILPSIPPPTIPPDCPAWFILTPIRHPVFTHSPNSRRATPERVLLLFAAFVLLAAISAVRDARRRATLEHAVPLRSATTP